MELGRLHWHPEEQKDLADGLRQSLDDPAVIDLVFYGSQAHGGRTGFSDVDAVLVVTDEAADDPGELRRIRSRVLAAQRAVIDYQPMQHHGFDVATPRLLEQAEEALGLPEVALANTRSLKGAGVTAAFAAPVASGSALASMAGKLGRSVTWPRHPWEAHRQIAMFELLPSLYLQARGVLIPKRSSFEEARGDFGDRWWPYDVLAEVRRAWPRSRRPILEGAALALRNPWAAVAAWRRLPISIPAPVRPLLTPSLLRDLRSLAQSMGEQA
jgi:hypothetical protein